MKKLLLIATLVLASFSAHSTPVAFNTETLNVDSPIGTLDSLSLFGTSGNLDTNGTFATIGLLSFFSLSEFNFISDQNRPFDFNLTVGGITHLINLPYFWDNGGSVDKVSFIPATIASQLFGSYLVEFKPLNVMTADSGLGNPRQELQARIAPVPEPAMLVLMAIGLIAFGYTQRTKSII